MHNIVKGVAVSLGILVGCNVDAQSVPPSPPSGLTIDGVGSLTFSDDFEYAVGRSEANAADLFAQFGGWTRAKTYQSNEPGARGYLYTVERLPGYVGVFPGENSRRVLALESLPTSLSGQTDFYLQAGTESGAGSGAVPANVWIQFWIYTNYYDDPNNREDQVSRFARRDKWIYPCDGPYPCQALKWLVMLGEAGYEGVDPNSDALSSPGARFLALESFSGATNNKVDAGDARKLYQNLSKRRIEPNQWTLVKIHVDTSGPSGVYEAWLRPSGQQWVKVSEWVGRVTPDFTWDIPTAQRGGHRVLRIPTTMNLGSESGVSYDSWTYLDDFIIADSESALPKYDQ